MAKNIILFDKDELNFKEKFYRLMDLLIAKQAETRVESFLLMTIFYLQILSAFFSEQIGVFNSENGNSDKFLIYIGKIFRLKGLFQNSYEHFLIVKFILLIFLIIAVFHFLISCFFMSKESYYSYNIMIINYYIKIFNYILYNIIFDIFFSSFCLGEGDNINFTSVKCSSQNNLLSITLSLIVIIVNLCIFIFINIYYNDCFFLSNCYFSKISCNYDDYWGFNCMIISLLSIQSKFLSHKIFFIYNLVISFLLLFYYINNCLYYDKYMNIHAGIFHSLYVWTSVYSLIFSIFNIKEKGITYILTCFIICFFYPNIKNRIENYIFLETPFYQIDNKCYLLYYFRRLINIINTINENPNDKSFLFGIIKMHKIECPNPNCITKIKSNLYLPLKNKWNNPIKKEIDDEIFLKNFIVSKMINILYTNECPVDMYLNLSLYYLKIIGNYCQSIYFYKKSTELKFSLREEYTFIRLSIQISNALIEKLKPSNEQCAELENLDISMFYKYDSLSQNFLDEINNDVSLSLEFWKSFRLPLVESNKKLDFNKIFELTDKIGKSKINVEKMWNKLLQIYSGVNEFFQLYVDYVEQINDDDLKKRDLESLRRKDDNFGDNTNSNFYSVLFSKETGIIIANGDLGNEGIIELSNKQIENIFKYKSFDLKGMNLTTLMPKLFAIDHSKYMENYFKIGEKKIIDKSEFKSFGKDKNNSIIKIKLAIKLFPILNEKVYFVGLIIKENIDDIILLDNKFNIQGMSLKLMKILNINNRNLFQENEIPFYAICKKFINFHNIFLKGKKKGDISERQLKIIEGEDQKRIHEKREDENIKNEKEEIDDNLEINENVELEYEIKLPQFLIDYSENTNKKLSNLTMRIISNKTESEDQNQIIEEFDENDLLIDEEKNKDNENNTPFPIPTPTPIGETPTAESISENSSNKEEKKVEFNNKQNEEEKIFNLKIEKFKTLFREGKIKELEELIDICNKNSSSIEYRFSFTFDKFRYGNKQLSYIVRCIDNKNDIGKSQEESGIDLEPIAAKYKKEKTESIKPLFELLEEEKKEIIDLPEIFVKLSIENKKFKKLLEICKNDINIMSKTYGHKKEEVLEDENSSQSSQAGFDSGLVKKNRIEEIRSNLLTNISSFYTLKYIKMIMAIIGFMTIAFSIIYVLFFIKLYQNLKKTSDLNMSLFQATKWTVELISLFISIRTLFIKEVINKINQTIYNYPDFLFNDYLNDGKNNSYYYDKSILLCLDLFNRLTKLYGFMEMEISEYLTDDELMNIYWNRIKISYMNEDYIKFSNRIYNESFPMAITQLLSNTVSFYESNTYNNIYESVITSFTENFDLNLVHFNYMTFIIIENGYNNILPNQFKKLMIIPDILSKYNSQNTSSIIGIICFYEILIIILCCIYSFLIHLTNKSMTDGMEKVTKIKLEKIEEIIKRIKIYNSYLKKFREKDIDSEENKDNMEIENDLNKEQQNNKMDLNEENEKNKINQKTSLNNNGFNTDFKKYIPLTILNYLYLHSLFIFLIIIICLAPIFINSMNMVSSTNQLLLVQNYIFGKLINTCAIILEIKFFMSKCNNNTILNYTSLVNMNLIQEVIKGISLFPEVDNYYNKYFLLDACAAAFNNIESKEYLNCLKDQVIISANNTDNLMKLIDDLVDSIVKEHKMNKDEDKINLYNTSYFRQIEYVFFNYISNVDNNFAEIIKIGLNSYLFKKKIYVITFACVMGIAIIFYCLLFGVIMMKKLIHHLSVSRCIMKIIPTFVIISTPELEDWIENKF